MRTHRGVGLWGAVAALALLAAYQAQARDHEVIVAIHVDATGLDLSKPADGYRLYSRLRNAAWIACRDGARVNLEPVADPARCYDRALGAAVRSANAATVTQAYLTEHSLEQALVQGIYVPDASTARRVQ